MEPSLSEKWLHFANGSHFDLWINEQDRVANSKWQQKVDPLLHVKLP